MQENKLLKISGRRQYIENVCATGVRAAFVYFGFAPPRARVSAIPTDGWGLARRSLQSCGLRLVSCRSAYDGTGCIRHVSLMQSLLRAAGRVSLRCEVRQETYGKVMRTPPSAMIVVLFWHAASYVVVSAIRTAFNI